MQALLVVGKTMVEYLYLKDKHSVSCILISFEVFESFKEVALPVL